MPYRGLGILDDTHVRFFTLNGVTSLFEESGFRLQEVARTTLAFDQPSDLVPDVRLLRVPGDIERHVRDDPENETLQFVVRAVMLPGEWDMGALRGRLHDVEARAEEQAIGLRNLRREHAAALALAQERGARIAALERAVETVGAPLRAERDDLAARLDAAALEAHARGEQVQLAAARQAELEREVSGTFAALAAVKRERDDALLAQASEEEARRGVDLELVRAKSAMREAIEQRDDARSVLTRARAEQQARENELRHRLEGAQREVSELRDALNGARDALATAREALAAAQDEARVLAEDRARFEAAAADAEQRVAALADSAEQLARAETTRAGLENALAHAKHALLSAIEERETFAAAARDAQERLARHEADAGDVHAALRAAMRADAVELAAFRERTRRETLVRIARDHDDVVVHDDGAQFWRAGAAT